MHELPDSGSDDGAERVRLLEVVVPCFATVPKPHDSRTTTTGEQ